MIRALEITGLIICIILGVVFWNRVRDAFIGLAMRSSDSPIMRLIAKDKGYGFPLLFLRLALALVFTFISVLLTLKIFNL